MRTETYSHCNGEAEVESGIKNSLLHVLNGTNFEIREGCGSDLRKTVLAKLTTLGWSDKFALAANSQISLTSYLDNHVLCFQTGNMSRFYADILKMQFVYKNKKAQAAFYVLPSKDAAKILGSNIANFVRLKFELDLFKDIITIPTLVIGIS
jgi:hypothetical protein